MNHIALGLEGENIAVNHLVKNGYEILERNYRWKKGELDIICRHNGKLVIVEVKTRNSSALGQPYLAVSLAKQRQIIHIANQYIRERNITEEVRFDIFSIILNERAIKVDHIIDAFYPLV
jgi:putative endonuclease